VWEAHQALLSFRAAEQHIKSSDTLYSEANRTLIWWCGASCRLQVCPPPRRRVAGDSPKKFEYDESMSCYWGCCGRLAQRHPLFSMSILMSSFCVVSNCLRLSGGRGGGGGALPRGACRRPRSAKDSRMLSSGSSEVLVRIIYHK
jgi:hypothetical protein